MTVNRDEAEALRGRATAEDLEQLEQALRPRLLRTLTEGFGLPDADAEVLVEDVFVSFLTASAMVNEPQGWLIAEACRAAGRHRRQLVPPDATAEERRAIDDGLLDQEPGPLLPARAREALSLR